MFPRMLYIFTVLLHPVLALRGKELTEPEPRATAKDVPSRVLIQELQKEVADLKEAVEHITRRFEHAKNPLELMAMKLSASYKSQPDQFWKTYNLANLCDGCAGRLGRLEAALSNPCGRKGCEDKHEQHPGSCKHEKHAFLKWSIAFCIELHKRKGDDTLLRCAENAVDLLHAEYSAERARAWAQAPKGKDSVVFGAGCRRSCETHSWPESLTVSCCLPLCWVLWQRWQR